FDVTEKGGSNLTRFEAIKLKEQKPRVSSRKRLAHSLRQHLLCAILRAAMGGHPLPTPSPETMA
ncbi:hypothetical protein MKD50_30420, partial [Cupriavidus sp. WGtm5]|uniref:hypothetical protein n=1 Tax=unclassified Cupriavidus TaxID=2640874 RepID=UPI0020918315